MKYLLDTDICIQVLRGNAETLKRIQTYSADDFAISAVTYYELMVGVEKCAGSKAAGERKKVDAFIDMIHWIPFGDRAARQAAKIRFLLEKRGAMIGSMDVLIAATAIESGLTLITGNLREFSRIAALRCEGWAP